LGMLLALHSPSFSSCLALPTKASILCLKSLQSIVA
jgi:hypothetical protein